MNSTLAASFLHLRTPSSNRSSSYSSSSSSSSSLSFLHFNKPLKPHLSTSQTITSLKIVKASSNVAKPISQNLKNLAKAAILIGATVSMATKFSILPAKAQTPATLAEQTSEQVLEDDQKEAENESQNKTDPLGQFLNSSTEAVESLKTLLQKKLENGEDGEALKVLERLVSEQPSEVEWKFLTARLLNEMGQTQNARQMFEEILQLNPLSFEALFENALLMDRCGEGQGVISRLQEALDIAQEENKVKEARDVRLIMAQIQFLQKNVDEALKSYDQLSKEDPSDFRPYFCRGMIYSLLDRNEEARDEFSKYRELSPRKFEVEGYLRTPLSRMKVFGSNEDK
ncbi:hypothetical protein K2173_009085 [Erythroxylum novogranatense]|uniref:Uncharacterized protein n=1 Tax=Erythroxylum novogranatense TaxID=1862640 RepID=A0AAV8TSM3_9ROSI|nr:hypothetical protein K2173_009085 [Erythroxylum novogranatense]